jgi:uncharacterized protein (DUF697 family)
MTTCREEAMRWVHRYAVGGGAFALLPLPVSTSAGLAALETHMLAFVAEIYADPAGGAAVAAAGGGFAAMGQGLKFFAVQACGFVPVLGPVVRAGIAAATIESLGRAIVGHFERKHPGKTFSTAS